MLAALLLTVAMFAPASSARQEAGGMAAESGRVSVALGAVDKEGRAVEGLKPEDLRVKVEDAEQKVLALSRRTEEPLHVVILLDASASQEKVLPFAQTEADQLVSAILMRGGLNDAAVVSFTGDAKVVQGLTADAAVVRHAISSVKFVPPPGYLSGGVVVSGKPQNDPAMRAGSTAIWDALVSVCDEVFVHAKAGRRIVVLVSDGVDTSSRVRADKVFERLLRDSVTIYSVGIADKFAFEPVDKDVLGKLSERTGGRVVYPKKPTDLPSAFEKIRGEMLTSYSLSFATPAPRRDGKPLKLRVEVVNPELRRQGVQLAHPQSLFIEPAAAPAGRQ